MMSSTTPSANQPWPGSPPRSAKGSTARLGTLGPARPAPRWRRRHDEAIADARHGRDPVLPAVGRAERLAQRGDLHGQVAVLDDDAGPGPSEEIGLAHDPARRLGEGREHRERPLADRDRCAVAPQRPARRVENERTEGDAFPLLHARIVASAGPPRNSGSRVRPKAAGGMGRRGIGPGYGYDLTKFSRRGRQWAPSGKIIATRVGFFLIRGARGLICVPTTPTHAPL